MMAASVVPHLNPATVARLMTPGGVAPEPQDDWVEETRRQIPATQARYFQTAGIGPSPQAVMDEVKVRLDFQNRGPVHPQVSPSMSQVEPDVRAQLAAAFGATPDEVALTHSTSEGINIAVWALNWQAGDEVIISNQEHPANTIPWYNLRDRYGLVLRRINLDAGTPLLDEVRAQLTSRTRMVSISHVSRNNGRRLRADQSAELAALLRGRDIRYHLDGAQGPGCVPLDLHALGCDYYSTCGHKWLLGPKGTGAFFVRREMLDRTLLSWTGAHSHTRMDEEGGYELIPAARRFEFGTRALADFAGLGAALSWMEHIGLNRIYSRIQDLVQYAIEEAKRQGYGITSPEAEADRSGVFVVRLPEGCDGLTMYNKLREHEATFASPVRHERDLRLAIHFFNTREEIDATFAAIQRYCS